MSANSFVYDSFVEERDLTPQEVQRNNFHKFIAKFHDVANTVEEEESEDQRMHASFFRTWNPNQDPIKFKYDPVEPLRFDELIQTENKLLQKVELVLASLIQEMNELQKIAQFKFYPTIAIFGEGIVQEEGEKQVNFGKLLFFLMDLWNFIERVQLVLQNFLAQVHAMYSNKNQTNTFAKVMFIPLFKQCSQLLQVLVILDEMIQQNKSFSDALIKYKRLIGRVMADPEKYSSNKKEASRLQYLIQQMEGEILDDAIFRTCVQKVVNFYVSTCTTQVQETKQAFEQNIKLLFQWHDEEYMANCCIYILYLQLFVHPLAAGVMGINAFAKEDKKFFKQVIFETGLKKYPMIHLYGNTIWLSIEFLHNKCPEMCKMIGIKNALKESQEQCIKFGQILDTNLKQDILYFYTQLCQWIARIESSFENTSEDRVIGVEGNLILQGVDLSCQISQLLKNVLFLHFKQDRPLTMSQLILLCNGIEMLKTIQSTYHRKATILTQYFSTLEEFLSFRIQKILLPMQKKMQQKAKPSYLEVDQLSSLNMILFLCQGIPTHKKLLLLKLNLAILLPVQSNEYMEIMELIHRMEKMRDFESWIHQHCDCSFVYWFRQVMVPLFFEHIYKHPLYAAQLPSIFSALEDCQWIVKASPLQQQQQQQYTLLEQYKQEIMDYFYVHIQEPLCHQIENDLRIHIHTSTVMMTPQQQQQIWNTSQFFKMRPIRFFDEYISLEKRVAHYLDQTFYNLTTITQSDWKIYEEMRNLAREKYSLDVNPNVYLPGQTLEQGLDILEITRNIHKFVSRFAYNLNNNMFWERSKSTTARNLNTVNIRHVANSIRTHGTGIMNTTVNFVYKYLAKKFFIFSQFLYDDHIKSKLIKEARIVKEEQVKNEHQRHFLLQQQQQLQQQDLTEHMTQLLGATMQQSQQQSQQQMHWNKVMYPLKRAEKLCKDIRKLGMSTEGASYLDQFRLLITEIGNALGYVRMVRAGGLKYIADAVRFVPNLDQIPNFEELSSQGNFFNSNTVEAAKNLYQICEHFKTQFAEGSDYFKILERVFKQELDKQEKHNHLKNFYLIIPPLTLSYIETMIIAKEKMIRPGNRDGNFCDDGFALGCAFILKILDQNDQFNSLHWFESVAQKYEEDYQKLSKSSSNQSSASMTDEESVNTYKLTLNRIQSYKKEFETLFFSFSGATIFFK